MDSYAFVVETEPRTRDIRYLQHCLYEYNAEQTGFHDGKSLAIFLRDASGSIAAGLYGWTWAGCLKVSDLWVRGVRAVLDTHSFQAPGFYQRRGYSVVGVVEDFPPGHRTYTLFKSL